MEARRIFQTTLVHPMRPEFSVAALFLGARIPAAGGAGGTEEICRALAIEPLSDGEISVEELRRVLACLLTDNMEVFDMNARVFRVFVNESGIDESFLEHALSEARLVIAREGPEGGLAGGASAFLGGAQTPGAQAGGAQAGGAQAPGPPAGLAAQTLDGLLASSITAGFGLYRLSERDRLHDVTGRHAIELLFMILPAGLLLVGSQRGLDRALHFGLYERLHATFI